MTTWTPERLVQLQTLRANGVSFREIARTMHLSLGQVSGKLHRLGGYQRPSKPRKYENGYEPNQTAVLAVAIINDGGSWREAMAETGLSKDEIYRAIRAAKNRERAERKRMEDRHA